MTQPKNFEIAIVGGGIAGLALGIALRKRNIPFKIYEQAAKFGEIGAGIAFSANAIRAMEICDTHIVDALDEVKQTNIWPEKEHVYLDICDGTTGKDSPNGPELIFSVISDKGLAGTHRGHFIDAMMKHAKLPEEVSTFHKRVEDVTTDDNGKLIMHFHDGTTATADAVIACDGIKSQMRRLVFGDGHSPVYTRKYTYRGMIPMDKAIKAVGRERAQNANIMMGPGAHLVLYPVDNGRFVAVNAIHGDTEDWPNQDKLVKPAHLEDVLRDFEGAGGTIEELLKLYNRDLNCWGLFNLATPLPAFNAGRICLIGDAAHASTPHHGTGGALAIEDAAVLSSLLADESVHNPEDLEIAFQVYDEARRERSQWVIESSRLAGKLMDWEVEGIGKDFSKIEKELKERTSKVVNFDVQKSVDDAILELRKRLDRE